MKLQELKDKRAKIAADMRALHEKAEKEERGFTADDDAAWAAMDADLQSTDAAIKRAEKLEGIILPQPTALRGATKFTGQGEDPAAGDAAGEEAQYRAAFDAFLRNGMMDVTPEQRQLLAKRRNDAKELRAFTAGTSNTGGYTVPQDFRDQLEIAIKAFGGMMAVSEILRTDTGATLPMPTFNYTNVVATIVGEGVTATNDSSTPFGVANLGAFTYRSPLLPVSYEFLQDSAFGEGFIVQALSQSIARAVNVHATTGTGAGQPRGIVIDAVSGKVGTTGQTLTVIFDDLIDLVHSVDPAYRPQSQFMMHDGSLKIIRKLKDTQNRPIFLPGYDGLAGAMADTLLGYPIQINQDVAVMAANAKSILFGALNKYKLRIVKDITMLRLTERYADNLQVAFLLFMRADGRLLDAGTNPVKYYQNSAT